MAQILAFAGSNSSTSINYRLVRHTVSLVSGHEVRLLNMSNYPFPMYSADVEQQKGYSNSLVELKNDMQSVDALIIGVNEHNGNPSSYFKNLLDWLSRLERKFLAEKRVFLLSTSTGRGGGANALGTIEKMLPRFGAEIVATFSLPSFNHSFNDTDGIIDEKLKKSHQEALNKFSSTL
ncbi:NAD(P)H-dependent oxidoreductase [Allomuricauda sp. d1]|uniref:NADPH-dependent FMN reductase n=1 Tax=Allomuricauda sp. d1 TaxID=3136725 RepID=UPI0031E13F4F